jgi:hypothetical protein
MNVTLVYPRWDYPTFGQLQEPLGLLHIGAVLEARGHAVEFFDLAVDSIRSVDESVAKADLVGISSSTVLFGRACLVLRRVKE